ncbi:hypothetical protein [uncultured Parasutterella sp.]|uniref:hypothetical protein n=1 Tax=uncultured Parasutterella sp. TaxID=1263098 RepID=UPI0025930920|nr:hypothetical protein [uncultured Parasutterella sp.]
MSISRAQSIDQGPAANSERNCSLMQTNSFIASVNGVNRLLQVWLQPVDDAFETKHTEIDAIGIDEVIAASRMIDNLVFQTQRAMRFCPNSVAPMEPSNQQT